MGNELKTTSLTSYNKKEVNSWCRASFLIGIASMFLVEIGIIPITGLIISIIGLVKFDKEKQRSLWMGIMGLILNLLYTVVNASLNGHIL